MSRAPSAGLDRTGRCGRRTRPGRARQVAVHGARSRRKRRDHLRPDRLQRRRRDQRSRCGVGRPVAARRAAAADLGGRLGGIGGRSVAAVAPAGRRADRPVRAAALGHQRPAAAAARVRPPGLRAGRARNRDPRPPPIVHVRLRRQQGRFRNVPGERRLDAGAVGCRLRAGRPPRGGPRDPRPV